jgi:hypothetical protein
MENKMNKVKFLRFWSVAVGSMDAVTGLLLVFVLALVLRMLKIEPPSPDAGVFLSWIGVFVTAVGLSYGMALGGRTHGATVWAFTALVRILVALFLVVRILDGTMDRAWALVGASDGIVGVLQILILRAGWWKGVPK